MAFLGLPVLTLGTPSRPSPTSPGTVPVMISVPLFVERLERCFAAGCPEALRDPMYQLNAEIWSSDRNEPAFTIPVPLRDQVQLQWTWSDNGSMFKRVPAADLASAQHVPSNSALFVLDFSDSGTVAENTLNEDWGPAPPPGHKASNKTRDELFLRVYLATVFSSWQPIQTADSAIVTGQFFGP